MRLARFGMSGGDPFDHIPKIWGTRCREISHPRILLLTGGLLDFRRTRGSEPASYGAEHAPLRQTWHCYRHIRV